MGAEERDIKREYATDEIAVLWEPAYCIHSANCIRSQPEVFNPRDRPWVHVERATADEIAAAILRCPTGALHFRRLDGGPEEEPRDPATVLPVPDGPLELRGAITVLDQDGGVFREDTRVALCRCGESRSKPFCDNSHRLAGFRAPGYAPRSA
jgi:uncharacterized Fe-S cluster protein YjdI/CDGSH-type Zn-finger protein